MMMSLSEVRAMVRGWFRSGKKMEAERFHWKELSIYDARPVKLGGRGHFLNKAGRLVIRACSNLGPIKVYQAANAGHAAFIKNVSSCACLGSYFPRVLATSGSMVVSEWVQGETLNNNDDVLERVAQLQKALHSFDATQCIDPQFDYWYDFIRPRFAMSCDILGERALASEVCERVDKAWKSGTPKLMHPDLSVGNIVRTPGGELKIVDNELLSIGGMAIIDVCNTARSLSQENAKRYLDYYRSNVGNQDHGQVEGAITADIQSLWFARELGSCMVSGSWNRAAQYVAAFKKGESILPWSS